MKDYILSVSTAIIVCVVVNLAVPSARYSGIMKIICGLFVVHTLISPIKNILNPASISIDIDSYASDPDFEMRVHSARENFDEIINQSGEKESSKELTAELRKRWNSSITASVVGRSVRIRNAEAKDIESIKNYIKEQYGFQVRFYEF